ncbi:MAG: acyltransferase [Leucobacter sp.]|nr:acyltransferase [Leucobacter sp.]
MSTTASAEAGHVVTLVRLDSLTGLRWWAAFGVFVYHMVNFAPVPILNSFALHGHTGVAFFFVLSGFVLTYSSHGRGTTTRNFYWRRFARIYPAHFVALLLAIPVFYSFSSDPAHDWIKPFSVGILLLSVVLVQGWSRDPVILFSGNPAAWTLTAEAFFYFLHPWVNSVLRLLRMRGAAIWVLTAFGGAVGFKLLVLFVPGWWAQLPLPITRLSEFIIGMGVAQLLISGYRVRIAPIVSYLLLAAFLCWLVLARRNDWTDLFTQWVEMMSAEIFVALFALIVLTVGTRDARGAPSFLKTKVMLNLGAWSFSFYLVHATVMYAFIEIFGRQPIAYSNLLWYVPTFAFAMLVAWALYRFIEHPFERRMRRWGNKHLA